MPRSNQCHRPVRDTILSSEVARPMKPILVSRPSSEKPETLISAIFFTLAFSSHVYFSPH